MKTIQIKDIEVIDNVRTHMKGDDLSELMQSIRQQGLLQPICVYKAKKTYILKYGHRRLEAMKKLGWTNLEVGRQILVDDDEPSRDKFLITNASENIHRKDIHPVEFGRVCNELRDSMTVGEIAAAFSIPVTRVQSCLQLYDKVPEEFQKYVEFGSSGAQAKKGKLPVSTVNLITGLRLPKKTISDLLYYVRDNEMSKDNLGLLIRFIREGYSVAEAKKLCEDYTVCQVQLVIKKDSHKKYKLDLKNVVREMLKGKRPLDKNAFL